MEMFHGAKVVRTEHRWGLCLGPTIYVHEKASGFTLKHEYGHYLQWKMLGPLYYLVIGIPSLVHACIHQLAEKKWDYYSFYTEAWANELANEFFQEDIRKSK